jgi:hypothetical protein
MTQINSGVATEQVISRSTGNRKPVPRVKSEVEDEPTWDKDTGGGKGFNAAAVIRPRKDSPERR